MLSEMIPKRGGNDMNKQRQDVIDNGGRRLGIDRRQVDLPFDGPDQRSGVERRKSTDRRKVWSLSEGAEERRETFYIK